MTNSLYAGLLDALEGEYFGAELMRGLRRSLPDAAAHAEELAGIERLETAMAAALARTLGLPDEALAKIHSAVSPRALTVAGRFTNWPQFAAESASSLAAPLARFRALLDVADAHLRPVVELLVRHEKVLETYLLAASERRPLPAELAALTREIELSLR